MYLPRSGLLLTRLTVGFFLPAGVSLLDAIVEMRFFSRPSTRVFAVSLLLVGFCHTTLPFDEIDAPFISESVFESIVRSYTQARQGAAVPSRKITPPAVIVRLALWPNDPHSTRGTRTAYIVKPAQAGPCQPIAGDLTSSTLDVLHADLGPNLWIRFFPSRDCSPIAPQTRFAVAPKSSLIFEPSQNRFIRRNMWFDSFKRYYSNPASFPLPQEHEQESIGWQPRSYQIQERCWGNPSPDFPCLDPDVTSSADPRLELTVHDEPNFKGKTAVLTSGAGDHSCGTFPFPVSLVNAGLSSSRGGTRTVTPGDWMANVEWFADKNCQELLDATDVLKATVQSDGWRGVKLTRPARSVRHTFKPAPAGGRPVNPLLEMMRRLGIGDDLAGGNDAWGVGVGRGT